MRRAVAIVALALVGALASACAHSSRAGRFEDDWTITSATLAGEVLPLAAIDGRSMHFDGGRYELVGDRGLERGDYVVLPGSQPRALDLHATDGPDAGRFIQAIFSIDGDVLVVAYDLSGAARPTRFESLPGTRQFLVRYRRS